MIAFFAKYRAFYRLFDYYTLHYCEILNKKPQQAQTTYSIEKKKLTKKHMAHHRIQKSFFHKGTLEPLKASDITKNGHKQKRRTPQKAGLSSSFYLIKIIKMFLFFTAHQRLRIQRAWHTHRNGNRSQKPLPSRSSHHHFRERIPEYSR